MFPQAIPPSILTFFMCLSSSSPVCSYTGVNSDMHKLLPDLCIHNLRGDLSLWRSIQFNLPLLFNALVSFSRDNFPPEWHGVFIYLKLKAGQPYVTAPAVNGPDSTDVTGSYGYFPNCLPKYRDQGKYTKDSQSTSSDERPCRKTHRGHPTLLPGIFTIYCPHGKFQKKLQTMCLL